MLYKKYHRNFVRQFKKGVKLFIGSIVRLSNDLSINEHREITKEPFWFGIRVEIEVDGKYILTIVFPSGKINKYIRVI